MTEPTPEEVARNANAGALCLALILVAVFVLIILTELGPLMEVRR